ncbi:MAG: hypothetical protein KatS3mg131_0689 [Candidatus Tectimicrobiota bacterium]|nr:MAG: hypothetical protein KatS3mg131_0689 [Candidatus Tectomicrobia bacterium]
MPTPVAPLLARLRSRLPAELCELLASVPRLRRLTAAWHVRLPNAPRAPTPVRTLVVRLHLANFRLWHAEDRARRPGAPDRLIAETKRCIDTLNQQRHDCIEQLDTLLYTRLYAGSGPPQATAELHSETPANLVDRLSILTLKVYHMGREARRQDAAPGHRQACRQRLALLRTQYDDLYACLGSLCLDLWWRRKWFKVYYQCKMYNDPELNPEIYRHRTP